MKSQSTLFTLLILSFLNCNAQNGVGDNFNDNLLSCKWVSNGTVNLVHILTEENSMLRVDVTQKQPYDDFYIYFPAIDISSNPILTLKIKSSVTFSLRVDLGDSNIYTTNYNPPIITIIPGSDFKLYTFDFTGKFRQSYPNNMTVNPKAIAGIAFFINPASNFTGFFYMENLQLGSGGSMDGIINTCSGVITSTNENLNSQDQIVIYPNPSTTGYFQFISAKKIEKVTLTDIHAKEEIHLTANIQTTLKGVLLARIKTENSEIIKKLVVQ